MILCKLVTDTAAINVTGATGGWSLCGTCEHAIYGFILLYLLEKKNTMYKVDTLLVSRRYNIRNFGPKEMFVHVTMSWSCHGFVTALAGSN